MQLFIQLKAASETAAIAKQNFVEAGLANIKIMEGSFDDILPVHYAEVEKARTCFY